MNDNDKHFVSLLKTYHHNEEEKKRIKKSKEAFDTGYLQACKQVRKQMTKFNAKFVCLDWSNGTSYDDDKFLPRSFTLYSLVQRHLLQKEMQKNNIGWSYIYGTCPSLWSPKNHMPWPEPFSTLANIYRIVVCKMVNKKSDVQELLTVIHHAVDIIKDLNTVDKDVAYLDQLYPNLPPILLQDLFNFSLYFGFEDMFIYSNAPSWNPAFINIFPQNYFRVLFDDPLELNLLPPQQWQWQDDSQEPWELEDTWAL